MGDYFTGFSRAVQNSDFIEMTYYAVGVLIVMAVIFLVAKFLKAGINARIRKISGFTLDFNDLKKMRETGLVSEEEYEKMKSSLVKRFVNTSTDKPISPEKSSQENPLPNGSNSLKSHESAIPPSPLLPPGKPPESASSKGPVDIEDLLEKGLITPDEYQKLKGLPGREKPGT